MHDIYQFVSGPLAWLAFTVFIVGSLYRLLHMLFSFIGKKNSYFRS